MHENVSQPRGVDWVAGRGAGCVGHGLHARRRDRPSPCPGTARRHPVRPAAAQAQPVTGAHGHAQAITERLPVTNAHRDAESGTVTDAQALAHPGAVTDAQALAHPETVAHPVPDAGTIAETITNTQPPIGAKQRSEPRGVH
jgi:hypothetical protein